MPIPSSGALSLSTIQTEFGGINPIGLNEYYAGGGLVPPGTTGTNGAVPSNGAISISAFYGTSSAAVWTPDGGASAGSSVELRDDGGSNIQDAQVTISCSVSATWNWSKTGSSASTTSLATGGSSTSITFTLPNPTATSRTSTFTVNSVANGVTKYWTVGLTNTGTN